MCINRWIIGINTVLIVKKYKFITGITKRSHGILITINQENDQNREIIERTVPTSKKVLSPFEPYNWNGFYSVVAPFKTFVVSVQFSIQFFLIRIDIQSTWSAQKFSFQAIFAVLKVIKSHWFTKLAFSFRYMWKRHLCHCPWSLPSSSSYRID